MYLVNHFNSFRRNIPSTYGRSFWLRRIQIDVWDREIWTYSITRNFAIPYSGILWRDYVWLGKISTGKNVVKFSKTRHLFLVMFFPATYPSLHENIRDFNIFSENFREIWDELHQYSSSNHWLTDLLTHYKVNQYLVIRHALGPMKH